VTTNVFRSERGNATFFERDGCPGSSLWCLRVLGLGSGECRLIGGSADDLKPERNACRAAGALTDLRPLDAVCRAPRSLRRRNGDTKSLSMESAYGPSTCMPIVTVPEANALMGLKVHLQSLVISPERVKAMDEQGIDIEAISLNPIFWYKAGARPRRSGRQAAKREARRHLRGTTRPVRRPGVGSLAAPDLARPLLPMRDEIAAVRVVEIEPAHDRKAVGVFAHRFDRSWFESGSHSTGWISARSTPAASMSVIAARPNRVPDDDARTACPFPRDGSVRRRSTLVRSFRVMPIAAATPLLKPRRPLRSTASI
jgi:hypothetical protein